ncbi:hypothetical protein MLD38_027583 [Melastoma candidum]|uniref:Uncharacterized protein n=1 Tax=Melastoma candidum TaxID=119954 RepID=A0ACB9P373_9MYRT|nr:hypothetical protein MLD38_027583 [Melastoma candidum]
MDSGATHHGTPGLNDFTTLSPYHGKSSVVIGNGQRLYIAHIGHTSVAADSFPLRLKHVLHTPHLSQRLVSVSKVCHDNDVSVEFNSIGFFVKNKKTSQVLLQGQTHQGLYKLPSPPATSA